MIIVDGDYHSGRQVRVIGSTNFNVTRDIKEITVAISTCLILSKSIWLIQASLSYND